MLNLTVRPSWDKKSAIQAGKDYVEKHGKITESCLRAENNLPTSRVVLITLNRLLHINKQLDLRFRKKTV